MFGDNRKEYLERFIVMEHLNLASDKLLDKWRHRVFQEVQKPSIVVSIDTYHDTFNRFARQNGSITFPQPFQLWYCGLLSVLVTASLRILRVS